MTTTVQKWGNSLGVRIPKNIAETMGLSAGGGVSISIQNGSIIMEPKSKIIDLKKSMKNYKPETYHKEIDWGKPIGNEIW